MSAYSHTELVRLEVKQSSFELSEDDILMFQSALIWLLCLGIGPQRSGSMSKLQLKDVTAYDASGEMLESLVDENVDKYTLDLTPHKNTNHLIRFKTRYLNVPQDLTKYIRVYLDVIRPLIFQNDTVDEDQVFFPTHYWVVINAPMMVSCFDSRRCNPRQSRNQSTCKHSDCFPITSSSNLNPQSKREET